ncbi:MAG: TetR family transcriptional regulator C-terminal domain-containing protein [Phycisphaeraceae bacterium]
MKDHDTKQRIIDAGTKVITSKGYHGCGLKEILDAAGVPKGSFYHYFKSKEDFGVAVIEDFTLRYANGLAKRFSNRDLSPIERVRDYYGAAITWYENNGFDQTCLVAKLGMDVSGMSSTMRNALRCGMQQWKALLAKCIREAQDAGEIDSAWDADELASLLFNAWEGVAMQCQIEQSTKPIHNFIDGMIDKMVTLETA